MADVRDNTEQSRFELPLGEAVATLDYRVEGHRLVLRYTEVPKALRGRGIGGQLVQAALARARAENLTVVPQCGYTRTWIEDHAEAAHGVTVWRAAA